jgi:hypothetical protein
VTTQKQKTILNIQDGFLIIKRVYYGKVAGYNI